MSYREVLERYERGELNAEETAAVEAELEKHDALGSFLFDREEAAPLPEAEDLDAAGQPEERFTEEIRRTVRRTFWHLGLTVGAAVLALTLLAVFALPHIVDRFYYDPTAPSAYWGPEDSQRPGTDLDLSVWTELFYPCGYRDQTTAQSLGYGKYLVTFHSANRLLDRPNAVSGLLDRDNLTLFDPNAFSRDSYLFFTPEDLGETEEARREAKAWSFDIAEREWNDSEAYTAYLTLSEPMAYEDFYRWCVERGLTGKDLWCHVSIGERDRTWAGLGFSLQTSSHRPNLWDTADYPELVLQNGWKFEEETVAQHFRSLLAYTKDHPDFTRIMGNWTPKTEEFLDEADRYVAENGLYLRGFALRGSKADFLALEQEPAVCNLSPFTVY